MADTITMAFVRNRFEEIELGVVRYRLAGSADERLSVRGKTSGAYAHAGTFQWTSAVRGVCAAMLTTVLHEKAAGMSEPHIQGDRDSIAASLDYALTKGPIWLSEMFGTASDGTLRAKRLFRVSNPNRKRVGPVTISVNPHLLPAESIRFTLDGEAVEDAVTLGMMVQCLLGTRITGQTIEKGVLGATVSSAPHVLNYL
jgi:hypothetical protein